MDDNVNILNGDLVQNLRGNWLDIAIILGAFILLAIIVSIIRRRLRRLFEQKISEDRMLLRKRTLTFNSVVSNLIIMIAFIAAVLIIAGELGISVTPLLAGAGVAGIVIGFGAQSLIKDLINGVFILFEQWYQLGDVVTIKDVTGTVERFNLRTTTIRDIEGTIHFFPNGEISVLGNRTTLWSRAVINIGVHYKENTDRVVEVLEGIFDDIMEDKKYRDCILERPSILGGGRNKRAWRFCCDVQDSVQGRCR